MATPPASAPAFGNGLAWPSEPMLAKPTDHLPAARVMPGGCLYEPKWDGYRGLVGVDINGVAQIRSRRGTDLTYAFPDIAAAVEAQLPPGTLLDGVISRHRTPIQDVQ